MSPRAARLAIALGLAAGACRTVPVWTANTPDLAQRLRVDGRDGRQCVRFAARTHGCFDALDVHSIAFDSAGTRAAYAVRIGERWGIAVDGQVGQLWDGVGAPVLSDDGAHVAHAAESDGRWRVVVDGVAGEAFDAPIAGRLRFAPGGARVAYAVRRGGAEYVVDGTRVSRAWREIGALRFSADGNARARLHYAAKDDEGWRVVSDGEEGERFDLVRDLRTSRAGVAYVASSRGREAVIAAGRVARWHAEVTQLSVTPEGRAAYVARDDSAWSAWSASDGGGLLARGDLHDLALGAEARVAWVRAHGGRQAIIAPQGAFGYDLVVAGTLQFVDGGRSWTALVGDRERRELRVVVNGALRGRSLDWSEVTRRMQQGAGPEGIERWVAAEAARMLAARR